jgi:hypothetical protein
LSGGRRPSCQSIRPEWKPLERLVDQQGYESTDEAHYQEAGSRYGDRVN